MGHDPRPAVVAGQIQPAPMYMPPVPPRSPWLEFGVFGLVGVQCLMLCFLAWQSFMFASQANDGRVEPASDLAQQQPGDRQRLYEAEALVAVQRQVLQDMVAAVGGEVEHVEGEVRHLRVPAEHLEHRHGVAVVTDELAGLPELLRFHPAGAVPVEDLPREFLF